MADRKKTAYPGVQQREVKGAAGILDTAYYITYTKNGKKHEESIGRKFRDGISAAKANEIRVERIKGISFPKKVQREMERAAQLEIERKAKEITWVIGNLKLAYCEYKGDYPSRYPDFCMVNRYLKPFFNKKPNELVEMDLDRLKRNMLKEGKSPTTIKYVFGLLRRIILHGVRKKLCDGLAFHLEMPKGGKIIRENLSKKQIQRLIAVLDDCPRKNIVSWLMRVMLHTGRRTGELMTLRWENVDMDEQIMMVTDTKNGQDLKLPFSDAVKEMFETMPRFSKTWVFPNTNGSMRKSVRAAATTIKKKAKIPKEFRPTYCLRHTFASLAASLGVTRDHVGEHLGHSKLSQDVTARYAHVSTETLMEQTNRVAEIIHLYAYGEESSKVIGRIGIQEQAG